MLGECSNFVTFFFDNTSLTETYRCAGALSCKRNQTLILHFSGIFLLTSSQMRRRMSIYFFFSIHSSNSCKLHQLIPRNFWSKYVHISILVIFIPFMISENFEFKCLLHQPLLYWGPRHWGNIGEICKSLRRRGKSYHCYEDAWTRCDKMLKIICCKSRCEKTVFALHCQLVRKCVFIASIVNYTKQMRKDVLKFFPETTKFFLSKEWEYKGEKKYSSTHA